MAELQEIKWTRMRAGLWNGVRAGKVVATVERLHADSYLGLSSGVKVKARTAEEARQLLSEDSAAHWAHY